MRKQVGERFASHRPGFARLDGEALQEFGLEVLGDLMGDGPLVPLLGRLRTQEDLLFASRPLCPAALGLTPVETDEHPQMALRQRDRIHWRPRDAGGIEQFLDDVIDCLRHLFACQVVHRQGTSFGQSYT